MTGPSLSRWNAPNAVTLVRIALVPVFAATMLAGGGTSAGWRVVATAVFVLAAATDRLDGYLARRLDRITDLGKLLDPIADKLLMGTALVILSTLGELPWWVTVVILVRELGITVMRLLVLRYVVLPASRGGKIKTVLQSVAIGLYLLPLGTLPAAVTLVAAVTMGLAVAMTVVTGVEYVLRVVQIRRAARA
ncbi:MAG: CDP-diacylglycerol--glycerol-3-phosphate 3-phosphatidyltransferase [Cellulomonas sp.]